MRQVIAGKALIACPNCGATVREDLLSDHEKRCKARPKQAEDSNLAKQAEAKRHEENEEDELIACPRCLRSVHRAFLTRHLQLCSGRRSPVVQTQNKLQEVKPQPKPKKIRSDTGPRVRKTADGYQIDTCLSCGQRICLVPQNIDQEIDENTIFELFDIEMSRKSRTPHLCDGSKPDFRRSRLLYTGKEYHRS